MALSLSKQHTFTSGTTILSAQVNTNLDDLYNAISGLEGMTKSMSNLIVDTVLRSTGTMQMADGSAAAPSGTYTTDLDLGLYRAASNEIGVSAAGSLIGKFTSTGLVMNSLKVSGLAAASAAGEAVRYEQLRPGKLVDLSVSADANEISTTSTTFVDTNIAATRTTTATTDKVLIIGMIHVGFTLGGATNVGIVDLQITRDGSVVSGPYTVWDSGNTTAGAVSYGTIIYMHLDSPGSVGSFLYKFQVARNASSNAFAHYVNKGSRTSRMLSAEYIP